MSVRPIPQYAASDGALWAGSAVWIAAIIVIRPLPLEASWAMGLLLLSPLVIAPLLRQATRKVQPISEAALLTAATSFASGFCLPRGNMAAILCLPWLLTSGLEALSAIQSLTNKKWRTPWRLAEAAGWIYLPIGAAWAVCDRLGYRPLDFEEAIVLLTAVHFHYAGFALPILTSLSSRQQSGKLAFVACYGVILATPLVAIGITCSQLGGNVALEFLAAITMTIAASASATTQLQAAHGERVPMAPRRLLRFSAVLLLAGMTFAAGYGSRHYFPMEWLSIARMRAFHGTLNAVGYTLLAAAAWRAAAWRKVTSSVNEP